jgi:hypothetical protein
LRQIAQRRHRSVSQRPGRTPLLGRKEAQTDERSALSQIVHCGSDVAGACGFRIANSEPPKRAWEAERADRAARMIARFRVEDEISDTDDPSDHSAPAGNSAPTNEHARRARDQLARELGRETPGHGLG